jgi:hypothetical protein
VFGLDVGGGGGGGVDLSGGVGGATSDGGGAGVGSSGSVGNPGTPNRGGGGGGGGHNAPYTGGAGGSGVVIVRYLTPTEVPGTALDDLTDVSAPANTPAGKVLGTTAEGVWGPIDPPAGGGGGGVGDSGWVDYTPVLSGWTQGNGTFTAKYRQVGQAVTIDVTFTLGSTTQSPNTLPSISAPTGLPIFALNGDASVRFHDAGVAWYAGQTTAASGTAFTIWGRELANGKLGGIGGPAPFTWGPGDQIVMSGSYFTDAPPPIQ